MTFFSWFVFISLEIACSIFWRDTGFRQKNGTHSRYACTQKSISESQRILLASYSGDSVQAFHTILYHNDSVRQYLLYHAVQLRPIGAACYLHFFSLQTLPGQVNQLFPFRSITVADNLLPHV